MVFCNTFCCGILQALSLKHLFSRHSVKKGDVFPFYLRGMERQRCQGQKNTHLKCLNEDTKELISLCLQHRALHMSKAHIKLGVWFPLAAELLPKRLLL